MKGAQEEPSVSTGGQQAQANRSVGGSAYAATNSLKEAVRSHLHLSLEEIQ